jgi:hypothetical protein
MAHHDPERQSNGSKSETSVSLLTTETQSSEYFSKRKLFSPRSPRLGGELSDFSSWSFEIVSNFGSFDKAQDRFMLRIFLLGDLPTLAFSLGGDGDLRRAGPFDNRHYSYRVAEQDVFVAAENDCLIRTRV